MHARKTFLLMSTRIGMSLFGYVSWFFIANHIRLDYTGSVGFAISFIGLFGLITELGFSTAHIKRISEGKDVGRCVGTLLSIKVFLLLIFTAILFIAIWGYKNVYPRMDFTNSYDEQVIYLMLIWFIFNNLTSVVTNTFIGKQQIAKTQAVLFTAAVIQAVITIGVVVMVEDVYLLALTWVVGAIASFAISMVLMWRTIPQIKPPTLAMMKSYTTFALPLMFVMALQPIVVNIDRVMIKLFYNNAQLAIYWNAQKFAMLPESVAASLGTVMFPAFSALIIAGKISRVRMLTHKAERYISMIITPIALILISISGPFILIFSDVQYAESAPIFSILMGWVMIRALVKPYMIHFASFDKPIYSLILSAVIMPLNIVLNLLFIPESIYGVPLLGMGAMGAALATLISAVINYAFVRYLSRKLIRTGVNTSVFRHIVSAGIVCCLIMLTQEYIYDITRFYEVIIFVGSGGLIYLGILIIFREFTRRDFDFFIDTFDIRKMYRYVKGELFGDRD